MWCPPCRHDNPDGVKFGGRCGTKTEGLCPGCGTSHPPTNKFCHQCGQALAPPCTRGITFRGRLYESQADRSRARVAYQSAMDVVDGAVERLQGQELKRIFLAARPGHKIREHLVQAGRRRY